MDTDKDLVATFTEDPIYYTLTITTVGSGTVTPAGTPADYLEGTVVPLTATPAAGWSFAGWSGDITDASASSSVTMDTDKDLVATFTKIFGSIEISKTILDRPEDDTEFTVTITGPLGYSEIIIIAQGSPALLEDLELGEYTITEVTALGYYTISINPIIVTLSDSLPNAQVGFTNAVDPPVTQYGTITVIKDVTNIENDPTEFEIVINGTYKVYVTEGTSKSITVPLGTYTVVETPVEDYTNVSITPSTFDLTMIGQTVTVVNEKFIPTGSITINKEFEEGIEDDTEFSVTVVGPKGYSEIVTISQGNPVTLSDLELGEYSLTETATEGYITLSDETVILTLDEEVLEESATFINGLEEIIIPPEAPPGDLPKTAGTPASPYFGYGILLTMIGLMFLFIQKRKEEMTF